MEPTPMLGSACAKAILLGEHAVVYGHPAIAVPLSGVRATVTARPGTPGTGLVIIARDLAGTRFTEYDTSDERGQGLLLAARNAVTAVQGASSSPDLELTIQSDIPVARGMGSSAAVSAAITRAVAAFWGVTLETAALSRLVYAADVHYHGTPSGVDNTVVAFERPVWFQRGAPLALLDLGAPLHLLVADTGAPSRTKDTVAHVRAEHTRHLEESEALLASIGALTRAARAQLVAGDVVGLGQAMSANHALLRQLGVSTPALDALVEAAQGAGALGAKLAGGGGGGCIVALTSPETSSDLQRALQRAGAVACYETTLPPEGAAGHSTEG